MSVAPGLAVVLPVTGVLLCLALVAAPLPVATASVPSLVQCETLASLDPWVAAGTRHVPRGLCPHVGPMAFPSGGSLVQAAAYLPETGEIGVSRDLDLGDTLGRSYLLHELVHAYQFAAGQHLAAACVGVLEREAYAVQAAYLRAHGQVAEAVLIDLIAGRQGTCRAPQY